MSEPYIGEIRLVGFTFPPVGFLSCAGQLLSISQYDVLYTLLGTTYGGDGQTTFGLPDLRGRVVVNQGQGPGLSPYVLGQPAGIELVALTNVNQLPAHNHRFLVSNDTASQPGPGNAYPAVTGDSNPFYTTDASALVPLAQVSVGSGPGTGQPHENRMPLLALNFIIATEGIYPTSN